jgi:hypothetical protein
MIIYIFLIMSTDDINYDRNPFAWNPLNITILNEVTVSDAYNDNGSDHWNPPDPNMLCDIAAMEGWHDHKGIFNINTPDIMRYVSEYTPPDECVRNGIPATSEPNYLNAVLRNKSTSPPDGFYRPGGTDTAGRPIDIYNGDTSWLNQFDTELQNRYIICSVTLDKNDDNSKIQQCFTKNGINEDIFICRDVAYGNVAYDIRRWGPDSENPKVTKVYNVQTASGVYDPGPSVSYYSDAGIKCGYQDINGKRGVSQGVSSLTLTNVPTIAKGNSRYCLFNPHSKYEHTTEYPEFYNNTTEYPNFYFNKMMYTKYNCKLYGTNRLPSIEGSHNIEKKNAENYITSSAVNLIVKVSDNQLYIVNQKTSNKATSILDLPFISSCIKYSAAVDAIDIARSNYTFAEYNIIQKSGPLKIMTKKFGDSGIALQTLRNRFSYFSFEPNLDNNQVTITSGTSNNIHCFLSYDQMAVAAALQYGAPAVIYNTHEGALVFISKKIQSHFADPIIQITNLIAEIDKIYETYNTNRFGNAYNKAIASFDDFNEKTRKLQYLIHGKEPPDKSNSASYDLEYQNFLKYWLTISTILQEYVPIDPKDEKTDSYNKFIASNYDTYVTEYSTSKEEYFKNSNDSNVDLNDIKTKLNDIKTKIYECFTYFRTLKQQIDTYERFSSSTSMIMAKIDKIDKLKKAGIHCIKIGDNEKIIQNCDPYTGVWKEKRLTKFFCFNGKSPNPIEFGIPIINSIVQKIPDALNDIRDKFIEHLNQIITFLIKYVLQKGHELFIQKLRDALNSIEVFMDYDNREFIATMSGGRSGEINKLSSSLSESITPPPSKSITPPPSKSITPPPPESMTPYLEQQKSNSYDRNNYKQIKENRTKYLNSIDEEFNIILKQLENTERNESFKAVITHMKDHISKYGRKFIDTLDKPYSMDHLHADREIHKPFFTLSLFKTFAQITQEIENTTSSKTKINVNDMKKKINRNDTQKDINGNDKKTGGKLDIELFRIASLKSTFTNSNTKVIINLKQFLSNVMPKNDVDRFYRENNIKEFIFELPIDDSTITKRHLGEYIYIYYIPPKETLQINIPEDINKLPNDQIDKNVLHKYYGDKKLNSNIYIVNFHQDGEIKHILPLKGYITQSTTFLLAWGVPIFKDDFTRQIKNIMINNYSETTLEKDWGFIYEYLNDNSIVFDYNDTASTIYYDILGNNTYLAEHIKGLANSLEEEFEQRHTDESDQAETFEQLGFDVFLTNIEESLTNITGDLDNLYDALAEEYPGVFKRSQLGGGKPKKAKKTKKKRKQKKHTKKLKYRKKSTKSPRKTEKKRK